MLAINRSWLLIFLLLKFCVGWLDERPTLESINGNLFISSAKDKNITLKTLGVGNVNINDINLLHAVWAAQNASSLVERWKSGILGDVESTLQRLSHVIEGPNGLLRKINAIEYASDTPLNSSNVMKPTSETESGASSVTTAKVRALSSRLRRLEIKVRSITVILRTNECASDPCQNGGTCIDSYDSFQCHCPPEWEGTLCSIDVNECERYAGRPSGCQNGATCTNLPGSFSCACSPGWHGFHCATQKSVCDESSNSELCGHGVCVKTSSPLGYTCICEPGWDHLADSDPSCRKDVDECTGSRYPCSVNPLVTCHNVPGTFYCGTCPAGYTGDGFKCQDMDECLVNNGGCSTTPLVECINTLGSRKCAMCPSGYQGDGVTCFYTGSCSNNNGGCHNLATCREGPNSEVLCLCPSGYQGNGKGPQGCRVAENACKSSPCAHGSCTPDGNNDFTCTCHPGYAGAMCDRPVNPCSPNPCRNNGTCSQLSGKPVCECTSSYTGPTCETPKQSCGGWYFTSSGYIEYPANKNKYDHGISCAWVIMTNSTKVLNVTFTRFSLEDTHGGEECKHDYVQIHDGKSAGSLLIGRYCGNKLPNNGTIITTHNAIYIWFRSDKSVNSDGFGFRWRTAEPFCGGYVDAEYGSITSPGFPGKYPLGRDCYWNVHAQPGKRITFHFISLALEEHPTCDYDYVEINETNYMGDRRIGIFCNRNSPPPLTTTGSEAVVHFHSDTTKTDNGFHLAYLTVAGSPDCGGVYTAERGEIVSPGYASGSYSSNMICDWEIRLPEGSHVRINWLNFEVERSRNCMFDSVQVYEGPNKDSPLIGRYCGSALPPSLSVKSNRVLLRFESDANLEEKGFILKYEVDCGGIFTESSGILESPFYPNYYPGSKECVYLISQPPGKAVALTFEFMDIEEGSLFSNLTECYFDRLEIRDGDTENSTLITTLCGTMHNVPTDPIYSTYNFMFIKFFTDASIHNRGFRANYTTIDRECGGIVKQGPGSLNIPGHVERSNKWKNNLDCLWTIRAPSNNAIQLTWISLPSKTSSITDECTREYIELVEDYGSTEAKSLGKYCPKKVPPQIMSTQGNDLTLHYHFFVDSDVSYQVSYVFVDDTHNCGGHYFTPSGYIRSPNYPDKYPKNKECIWVIEAESKYLVTLKFNSFQLENVSNCAYDYLEIRSGSRDNSPLLGKFCGDRIEDEITSMTNQMYIRFVSDASLQKKGFEIQWNSVKTGCGGNLHTSSGSIISPNYPQNYYHRAACTWNIRVSAGSVIRITFTDFDIEDHMRCAFDYLEISDIVNGYSQNTHRYCGSNSPALIESNSNQMKLLFRSDVLTNARGFHLRYTTDCHNKVSGYQGVIESPNFPQNYENLSNCTWIISAPAGNTVNITFSHFHVQASLDGNCKKDYVKIQEGDDNQPNTEIITKCGHEEDVLPLKISSSQRQVFVTFMSDRFVTASGFRLEWYVDGCSKHLTKPYGQFTSPGYPDSNKLKTAYVECQWLIEVDYDKSIEITFPKIDNRRSHDCFSGDNNGSIEIFNGQSENAPQLSHSLCYSESPVTLTSTGNQMLIKYASETNYASHGFSAIYKSVPIQCGGKFTGQSGVIHSAKYPKNYPPNQNCEWLITVDPNHVVNLTFVDLDLEKSRNCSDDYIKVFDGNSTAALVLGTHCLNTEGLPYYVSSGNQILVKMRTDALVSAKGFMAHYNRTCGARIVVDGSGIIRSSPTLHTMESLNCSWIIAAADPSDKVTLTFTHIDLDSQDCSSNHIEIYEGAGIEGPMLGQICDNKIPKPFYSTGDTLTIHLTTLYGHIVGDKFDAIYSSLSTACGGKYTAEKGIIASPNYPLSYPSAADCIWNIRNSPGNRITLTFESFELQESENCDIDYLEIRENNGIGKLRGVFCGKNIQSITSSQPLWIRFKSASNTVGNPKGFTAEYSLLFGNELTGDDGEIASPMYPMPYRKTESFSWRVTTEFNYVIRLEFLDFHFDHYEDYCYSSLKIYDGFDDEAPLLKELCGISIPSDTITSSSNIIFIEMENGFDHVGNWFRLKWLKIPRGSYMGEIEEIKSNSSEIIILTAQNSTYSFTSPGFPNGYEDNLRFFWTFVSPVGTHLVLRFETMDIEESDNCVADYVAINKGYQKSVESEESLLFKVCLSNSTNADYVGTNVMTVEFSADAYRNKTGFSATVSSECGGTIEESSGIIQLNSSLHSSRPRPFIYFCEWVVKVKPGRRIRVNVIENRIETNQPKTNDNSCRASYLMLKNGESSNSPLLGIGKYCDGVKPPVQNTTSNYLYVKLSVVFATVHFKLKFREIGNDCGGRFELSSKNDNQQQITSPNYPNIPAPHTECVWTFMSIDTHRLSIHFTDRFDLAFSEDCEKEYVEVRDGGTDDSPLMGRYCKTTPPSSLSTKGNILYVRYFTDFAEPRNGFKALITNGDVCGGIERKPRGGVITSPNYPETYNTKSHLCSWWIIGSFNRGIKIQFEDFLLPSSLNCSETDHVTILEKLPGHFNNTEVGTYCGRRKPAPIEVLTSEAVIIFQSTFESRRFFSRGFRLNYTFHIDGCGGNLEGMSGIIETNGYPRISTSYKYCQWKITVPIGLRVAVDIEDLDIGNSLYAMGSHVSFHHDLGSLSTIVTLTDSSQTKRIESSANYMSIYYVSVGGHRGMKARFTALSPAACGGETRALSGTLTNPQKAPFNESTYFCKWILLPPDELNTRTLIQTENHISLTLAMTISGIISRGKATINCQYYLGHVLITGEEILAKICGNITGNPLVVTSPYRMITVQAINATYQSMKVNFVINYKWYPCGGILTGPKHTIHPPKNTSYPVYCSWKVKYSDTDETILVAFEKMNLGPCDKSYIRIKGKTFRSPSLGQFCGNVKPQSVVTPTSEITIEYYAEESSADFEIQLSPSRHACGGIVKGKKSDIRSPGFPQSYPNNTECIWEIMAKNGYHVGLTFVERFNLETSKDCQNDYVEVYAWQEVAHNNTDESNHWKSLGKVCGRTPPEEPFNSTNNRMRVKFVSNEKIEGEGFKAVWYPNCGGVYEVTRDVKYIESPNFQASYPSNTLCNYTLVSSGDQADIVVDFTNFLIEGNGVSCIYDNLTINTFYNGDWLRDSSVWCGSNSPGRKISAGKMEIIFKTDSSINREGFKFKYQLNDCGGNITKPRLISPMILSDPDSYVFMSCVWLVQAPPKKSVLLRFEKLNITQASRDCLSNSIRIYEGNSSNLDKQKATFCGDLSKNLPVVQSLGNEMTITFYYSSYSATEGSLSIAVLFVNGPEEGCGGNVNVTSGKETKFRSQLGEYYEPFQDCHWLITAPSGYTIEFTMDVFDLRNTTFNDTMVERHDRCNGDYIEVRDGGPYAPLIGRFCGPWNPSPFRSFGNLLWIRFVTDGTNEGRGIRGSFKLVTSPCGVSDLELGSEAKVLQSPNYPEGYASDITCRWVIRGQERDIVRVAFKDFQLTDSEKCESEYLQIADLNNRNVITEGFGEQFIIEGSPKRTHVSEDSHMPHTFYKYCGSGIPHDYHSNYRSVEIIFKGSSRGLVDNKRFKIEYSKANCSHNFTSLQGRIVHQDVRDCWFTVEVPQNYTISLYFNQMFIPASSDCSTSNLQIWDGVFNSPSSETFCNYQTPSPIFSTGNRLSFHSFSKREGFISNSYDITYTATNSGRGCGGKLYNYGGVFTSPLYPNPYRNRSQCTWDVSVPKGLNVHLHFDVFDIGLKSMCDTEYLSITEIGGSGEETSLFFCGSDVPADFESQSNRVLVTYVTSVNNGGTGWVIKFSAFPQR